jgi:two-component system sensor histidine kinase YesM
MASNMNFTKLSPTRRRIIVISVLLTLLAQVVIAFTGFAYVNNMNAIINEKSKSNVLDQFYKNTLTHLNEINNLFQLMQTPDFSSFFRGSMNVRNEKTVLIKQEELLSKMNMLQLSSKMVERIYFIGSDSNQKSFYKDTNNQQFMELSSIRMDLLQSIKMSSLFLRDYNRLTQYSPNDLQIVDEKNYSLMNIKSTEELKSFIHDLENKMIISNGNINGVLVIIQLNPEFFRTGLPPDHSPADQFSVLNSKHELIWSSIQNQIQPNAPLDNPLMICKDCAQRIKELSPYPYSVLFMRNADFFQLKDSSYIVLITILSCVFIIITLLISIYYSKKFFDPYYILSSRMKAQTRTNELMLKSISDEWIKKGLNSLSLRNKLIILFSFIVIMPTITDGLLYAKFFNQTIQSQMKLSMNEIGKYTNVSFQNRISYLQNLTNQISVSQQLQEYLTTRQDLESPSTYTWISLDSISLSMFPGLNEVNYFVLFEPTGKSMYSSFFSNNLDIFTIDSDNLKKQNDPYWISEYKDVYGQTTIALLKRIHLFHNGKISENYLLIVPKLSFFDEISPSESKLKISDSNDNAIFAFDHLSIKPTSHIVKWSSPIPSTDWKLSIEFSNEEIIYKNRQYYYSFLFNILLMLILTIVIAFIISSFLIKPIEQLKRTMIIVGEGDFNHPVTYMGNNEIGEIIQSYNYMIQQLNGVIHENMKMIEENVSNKVRENELLSLKTEAEFKMLQAQINPHFLYNTLEAINMRSMKSGNSEISLIVGALAEMFRYSISIGPGTESLERELRHVQNYISIQQVRFKEQFKFEVDIPEHITQKQVAKFILQPIVENCLKHGLSGFDEGGLIRIYVFEFNNSITIEVSDNGIGMDKETVARVNLEIQTRVDQQLDYQQSQCGVGLRNVYQRLRLFYHEKARMTIQSSPMKGTTVSIYLPYL